MENLFLLKKFIIFIFLNSNLSDLINKNLKNMGVSVCEQIHKLQFNTFIKKLLLNLNTD